VQQLLPVIGVEAQGKYLEAIKMERKRLRVRFGLDFGLKTDGTCHSLLVSH